MGTYNPDSPVIVGQEWPGIREENFQPSRVSNTVEQGHTFSLATSRQIGTGKFYVNRRPDGNVNGQAMEISIYPRGQEDQSGPYQRVIIPVSAGTLSGGASLDAGSPNVQTALSSPSSGGSVIFSNTFGNCKLSFNGAAYNQQLLNKRIMAVNLLWAMRANGVDAYAQGGLVLQLEDSGATDTYFYGFMTGEVATTPSAIHRSSFGEVNPLWNDVATVVGSEALPWTMQQILRMISSASHPITVDILGNSASSTNAINLQYVALEVIYCEETRVAYGSALYQTETTDFLIGANPVTMRTPFTMVASPTLPAGVYTVVVSSPSTGDFTTGDSVVDVTPQLNALRQYYALPPHLGLQVNLPWPPHDSLGDTFTVTSLSVLPQISLHDTTGAPLTEPHVYGRLAAAPVYGNVVTSQGIDATAVPSATFPQARYYARRFGDTVTPLTLSQGSFAATITPAQFDGLTEIVDGWKEVNVRLSSAPTGTQISSGAWSWSATGETVGNRWEILGVSAPAISGTAGNLLNQVPSLQRLSSATYLAPSGSSMAYTWQSPQVSGAALDVSSDAVLLFSQDPPTVSGVGVATMSQAVTGLGVLCAPNNQPLSVPTAITYNQVSWTPPVGAASDSFSRSVAPGGWGNADVGGAWTTVGGSATDYSVTGGSGVMSHSNVNTTRRGILGTSYTDGTVTALITTSVAATGGAVYGRIYARYVDTSNHYYGEIRFNTTGTVTASIAKVVSGVTTTLATASFVGTYTAGSSFYGKLLVQGNTLAFTVWPNGASPPVQPTIITADSALTAGVAGVGSILDAANVNTLPVTVLFDNFTVSLSSIQYVELQRSDTVDPTWYPIMRSTLQSATGFADYEARIGILTSYRVRLVNVLGFVGAWSSTVTSTITAPGVTGRRVDNSVLVFTSNYAQSGVFNLAYAESWDGSPSEDFTFPESGRNHLQWLYGRDYMAAYRPTERGGEQFTRALLLQNAAIASGPVLRAAAQSLRDLAWADLPYVCVRNELGDRWFANVVVPSARIQRNRAIQVAQVTVTEVTLVPYAVNPGA